MDSTYNTLIGNRTIITTVTSNPHTVADWIQDLHRIFQSNQDIVVVGLDTEWKPNRYSGQNNPVATLQLCAGNRCLIIQLIQIRYFPQSLVNLLKNPRYTFAGVGIEKDVEKLDEDWGLVVENLYDVRDVAVDNWPDDFSRCPGLKELAEKIAGISMEKPKRVTTSNWAKQVLTEQQIRYACVDAFASCRIGVQLYFDFYGD